MKNTKFYFRAARFWFSDDPVSYQEGDKEYLVCNLVSQNLQSLVFYDKIWTRLLVPKDNLTFAKQIKEIIDKQDCDGYLFTTPFTNLKFKSDFRERLESDYQGHALLIKDPNQVEKLVGASTNPRQPHQIAFKVVNQFKEGYGSGKENKNLSYQESFSKYGEYVHVLEIEPLDLGIEDLPPITRLSFAFANEINPPLATGNFELTKCELYKSQALTNSVGKTFDMKVEEFKIDSGSNTLFLVTNHEYVFGSLSEKKRQNNPESPPRTLPKNDNPNNSSPNHEPQREFETWKVILITGGIVVVLSFLTFIIIHYAKKKKK